MLVFGGKDVISTEELTEEEKSSVSLTSPLLEKKRSANGEIIVTLFEDCNLTCKFCNQDHKSKVGFDTIRDKYEEVVKTFETLIKMRKKSFTVNIMGGELFQDSIPDQMFEDYEYLASSLHMWGVLRNYPVQIGFVSNLVHFNTARVKRLVDGLRAQGVDAGLCTSYDPHSRFNKANIEVFRKNAEIYKDYISTVNVILTAPNIEKFLSGDVPHFDYLYENFDIFFDYYTPEENHLINDPTDIQLRDMYKHLVHNYPNSNPVSGWISKKKGLMTCQSTITIMPDGNAGRCTILLNNFKKPEAGNSAAMLEEKFVTKMDCISCEYFDRCGLGCYLQQHFNGPNRKMNYCWMKDVHKEIDDVSH